MCLHTTNVVDANVVVAGVVAGAGVAALLAVHDVELLFGLLAGRIAGSHHDAPLSHTAVEQFFVESVFVLFGQLVVVCVAVANDAFSLADAAAVAAALSVAAVVLSVVVPAAGFEQMQKGEHKLKLARLKL